MFFFSYFFLIASLPLHGLPTLPPSPRWGHTSEPEERRETQQTNPNHNYQTLILGLIARIEELTANDIKAVLEALHVVIASATASFNSF